MGHPADKRLHLKLLDLRSSILGMCSTFAFCICWIESFCFITIWHLVCFFRDEEKQMRYSKFLILAILVATLTSIPGSAPAQVSVNIGPEPACPYGYYDYAPYDCAPYGYYGPEWFSGGVFIGAGPWFHGPHDFHGYVDNRFDPHHGYAGPRPQHGERAFNHFHGNEVRDGRGHSGHEGHR